MIPLLAPRTLTRLRYGAATISSRRRVRPTPTETPIIASVQPAPHSDRKRLPDGATSDGAISLVSYGELRGYAEGVYADVVRVPAGLDVAAGDYEVAVLEPSPAFLGQPATWYAVCTRVQPLGTA